MSNITYKTCTLCQRETIHSEYVEDWMHPSRSKTTYYDGCTHCNKDVEKAYHILKEDKKLAEDRENEKQRILQAFKNKVSNGCLVHAKKSGGSEVYFITSKKLKKGDIVRNSYNRFYKILEVIDEKEFESLITKFDYIHFNAIVDVFNSAEAAKHLSCKLANMEVDFVSDNLWILRD